MIVEQADFLVRPGTGTDFEAAFAESAHLLLSARGCREAGLWRAVDRADTYTLWVQWDSIDDHVEHFPQTEAGKAFVKALAPHCAAPPRVTHLEGAETPQP